MLCCRVQIMYSLNHIQLIFNRRILMSYKNDFLSKLYRAMTNNVTASLMALILITVGVIITIGGVQLMLLGGSIYYLLAGLVFIASGRWVWRGDIAGYWLYCLFALLTLVWAVTESGLDLWALLPRVVVPFGILLGFLIPQIKQHLQLSSRAWLATPVILVPWC